MNTNKRLKERITVIIGFCMMLAAVLASVVLGLFVSDSLPTRYESIVLKYSAQYDVPAALVFSVIRTESDFDPEAVSSAGAMGLMQITPETFDWLQTKTGENLPEERLFDPEISIRYGTYFLSILLREFENIDTAAAAYNAGMNAVIKWLRDPAYSDDGKTLKEIPYKETAYYVVKVNRALKDYRELYAF